MLYDDCLNYLQAPRSDELASTLSSLISVDGHCHSPTFPRSFPTLPQLLTDNIETASTCWIGPVSKNRSTCTSSVNAALGIFAYSFPSFILKRVKRVVRNVRL